MFRIVSAAALAALVGIAIPPAASRAATSGKEAGSPTFETREQIVAETFRQAIGAPARADIGEQATARLSNDLIIVPRENALKLLGVMGRTIPSDLQALLLGSEGIEAPGLIRFIPAGFIDSNEALAWTADDIMSSLRATVEAQNADRLKKDLPPLEARRWIQPPQYDPETHQLSWAALILPKTAPRGSDGEFTYHAIGFGRDGYVHLSIVTGVQKAETIGRDAQAFLVGLYFRPGKAYGDTIPTDRKASGGLAAAMEIDLFSKNQNSGAGADTVVPIAGGIVALVGAVGLLIYVRRHLRQRSRRV